MALGRNLTSLKTSKSSRLRASMNSWNAFSGLVWLAGFRLMLVATRLILRICRADYAPRIFSWSCTGRAFDLRRAPMLSSSTNTEKAMLAYT